LTSNETQPDGPAVDVTTLGTAMATTVASNGQIILIFRLFERRKDDKLRRECNEEENVRILMRIQKNGINV